MPSAQAQALAFGFAQVGVKLVEKLAYVAGLRAETRAGALDDRGIQAEALRDVDARGRAGNSDFQFVGGLERGLVETYGGVDHAGSVRAVDFERRVVGRDDGHAADGGEVSGNGDGEGGAFFGIGGRA